MKTIATTAIAVLVLLFSIPGKAQTWYQKEKSFHPIILTEAAISNVNLLKDIHSWKGAPIWSAVGIGIMNKNTSFDVFTCSYEWQDNKGIYIGATVKRRLFAAGRFEPWVSLAYSSAISGPLQMKMQPGINLLFHANKAVALMVAYKQVLDKYNKWSFTTNRGISAGIVISFHGNVNSNDK